MLDKLYIESQDLDQEDRASSSVNALEVAQPTSPTPGAVHNTGKGPPRSQDAVGSTLAPNHPVQQDPSSSSHRESTTLPAMVILNGKMYQKVDTTPRSDEFMRSAPDFGDTEQQNGSNSSNKDSEASVSNLQRSGGVVNTMVDDAPESDQLVRSASSSDDPVHHNRPSSRGEDPEVTPPTLSVFSGLLHQAEKPQESVSIEPLSQKSILSQRAQLLEDIQQKLVRYDEVLVHARRLAEFQRPTDDEWLNLRKWHYNSQYMSPDDEGDFMGLKHDLITLRPRTESGKIDDWTKRLLGSFSEGKVTVSIP